MVTNWQELQKEQEAAAGSVAELKTDFSNTMDELQAALAEDIEAMDLGDEAKAAGRATIQGYINAANDLPWWARKGRSWSISTAAKGC